MSSLPSQTALITGGAKRLGRHLALTLAEAGYNIALHYHTAEAEAQETARAIEAYGVDCLPLRADLMLSADRDALIDSALMAFGSIEVLVNNAAVFEKDTLATLTDTALARHQAINLFAPLHLIRRFAAQETAHTPRLIINLLDSAWAGVPDSDTFLSYTLSKAALHSATLLLARTLAPAIRVNGIAPGPVIPAPSQRAEHFAAQHQNTLLGYGATPAAIGEALRYLLRTPSVTGQILVVDGGRA